MSFNFSFSETMGASQSTVKPTLEGNKIHSVTFDGCEIVDIEGKKDPSAVYKVLRLKFSNDDGVFEHTVWEPRPEDKERGTATGPNGDFSTPSNVENMMFFLKHAIDTINPTIASQIDKGEKTLGATSWDKLRELVSKILNAGKGTALEIKLLKNKDGNAIFPGFFTAFSREGKIYMRTNFIGKKLMFTSYENTRIKQESTAVKTDMSQVSLVETANDTDISMDFDDIDAELGDINLL